MTDLHHTLTAMRDRDMTLHQAARHLGWTLASMAAAAQAAGIAFRSPSVTPGTNPPAFSASPQAVARALGARG